MELVLSLYVEYIVYAGRWSHTVIRSLADCQIAWEGT